MLYMYIYIHTHTLIIIIIIIINFLPSLFDMACLIGFTSLRVLKPYPFDCIPGLLGCLTRIKNFILLF